MTVESLLTGLSLAMQLMTTRQLEVWSRRWMRQVELIDSGKINPAEVFARIAAERPDLLK